MLVSYAKSLSEMAKAGAKIAKAKGIDCGKMCAECACKWEQDKTIQYFIAADEAAKRIMEGGEFNCHSWDYKCSDKPCAGFLMAKLAYTPETEKPVNKEL